MYSSSAHLSRQEKPSQVRVIVNPASTRRTPIIAILNDAFRRAGIEWDIAITHGIGDGKELASQALEDGVDVVAVYGGDGTVMEAASALVGTDTPLLILGGGTGNLVAAELRLPTVLEKSCELICEETFARRAIDVGVMDGRSFLLRVGCGLETGVVHDATRELKDHFGKWAYIFAGIKAIQESTHAEYEVRIDGEIVIQETGVACVIANAGTVGLGKLTLAPSVIIDDGLLDVFFLRKANIEGIVDLAVKMMGIDQWKFDGEPILDASAMLNSWQGKKIEVHTDPVQEIQADGDVVAETPMIAEVKPASLKVVVAHD